MKFVVLSASLLALFSGSNGQSCGRHSESLIQDDESYIIGGSNVGIADSIVSFQVFKSDEQWNDHEWKHVCGGALLNSKWVVTAAHCAKEFRDWGAARVSVGSANLSAKNTQKIKVRRVIQHPQWTGTGAGADWDIALVELQKDVRFNYEISPACVSPNNEHIIDFESCAAVGWGRVEEFSDFSDSLKAVNVNLMTYQQCMRAYRNMNGVRITKNHICAGRLGERGRGICQGDLGGPLFCRTEKGVQLAGVATNGAVCGSPQYPGVYIRIDEFVDWIRRETGDRSIGIREEPTTENYETTTDEATSGTDWDYETASEYWRV